MSTSMRPEVSSKDLRIAVNGPIFKWQCPAMKPYATKFIREAKRVASTPCDEP
jgi:hypothetical protein